MMKEFGSDFHYISNYPLKQNSLTGIFHNMLLLANGRQCIVELIRQNGWKRMWFPDFFCYEVIDSIKTLTRIEVMLYPDGPFQEDERIIMNLPFKEGDVLLRMNYFGTRDVRTENNIPIPVIEDHTHDLLGPWALNSNADWCIVSLRKSLPLPEGGGMWSPKGHRIFDRINMSEQNEEIAQIRWKAMQTKTDYLEDIVSDKQLYRKLFLETEDWFNLSEPSMIDKKSKNYIEYFDISDWQATKRKNWQLLYHLVETEVLIPENEKCTPFSFIILTNNTEERDLLRKRLLEKSVYPAILWNVPNSTTPENKDFSHRMLSIHCDGRYTEKDIRQLAIILNTSLKK